MPCNAPPLDATERLWWADAAEGPVTGLWRHRGRQTEYEVVGEASVQGTIREGQLAVVYKGADGHFWVRDKAEFTDGRFEAVPYQLDLPLPIAVP